MGRLIIYIENIKGFVKCGFCDEFLPFDNIIFQKENFCFGFDILNNLLKFLCP
jgi:hypothetical protein